ncbi:MAG: hypothetical protein KF864_05025 [Phycisphaeraceae bacterium]|nr:hypothetical protein [Phycisphaeraceae bacterium]MBX3409364.1 hypothetical protein [Phycisphaeraceae bacterium]
MSAPSELNPVSAATGFIGIGVGLLGIVLLVFGVPSMIALSVVLMGFVVFITAAMMSAKTTGGPQNH